MSQCERCKLWLGETFTNLNRWFQKASNIFRMLKKMNEDATEYNEKRTLAFKGEEKKEKKKEGKRAKKSKRDAILAWDMDNSSESFQSNKKKAHVCLMAREEDEKEKNVGVDELQEAFKELFVKFKSLKKEFKNAKKFFTKEKEDFEVENDSLKNKVEI